MNEAIRQVTHVQNIRYDKATERLYIIDQTLLPNEEKEIELRTVEEMIEAIKMLRIRGAPAIGICAGYCMYALARDIDAKDNETFYRKLQIDGELLGAARPTAVNLRWAVGEMLDTAKTHLKDDRAELLEALYRKAVDIHEDDIAKCTAISDYGLSLLKDGDEIKNLWYEKPMALPEVKCFNPSFDVTDHELLTGIVTEKGICYPPFTESLAALFKDKE